MYRGLQGATSLTETDIWQNGKGGKLSNKGAIAKISSMLF